ncbi:hypothetical protein [Nostoc sp.]|uniref:hypothetical protein n=1 Tax=Nostoc sp. TaxID=1180 RepID=UPI002FF94196
MVIISAFVHDDPATARADVSPGQREGFTGTATSEKQKLYQWGVVFILGVRFKALND